MGYTRKTTRNILMVQSLDLLALFALCALFYG